MTRSVTVYGFGSAFAETGTARPLPNDLDLLIVHPGTDTASCQFAIFCKRRLVGSVDRLHITMLSEGEEQHCQFARTAQAVRIGTICEGQSERDLKALCAAISALANR